MTMVDEGTVPGDRKGRERNTKWTPVVDGNVKLANAGRRHD